MTSSKFLQCQITTLVTNYTHALVRWINCFIGMISISYENTLPEWSIAAPDCSSGPYGCKQLCKKAVASNAKDGKVTAHHAASSSVCLRTTAIHAALFRKHPPWENLLPYK